ncbi:hypothetical protein M885DRAFT_538782 [Pelagophyceae sp. CCMP2097]|nr:hypothetical protein M885DRAFT_538782 [Pelagophyceae sp. CCMP2097]
MLRRSESAHNDTARPIATREGVRRIQRVDARVRFRRRGGRSELDLRARQAHLRRRADGRHAEEEEPRGRPVLRRGVLDDARVVDGRQEVPGKKRLPGGVEGFPRWYVEKHQRRRKTLPTTGRQTVRTCAQTGLRGGAWGTCTTGRAFGKPGWGVWLYPRPQVLSKPARAAIAHEMCVRKQEGSTLRALAVEDIVRTACVALGKLNRKTGEPYTDHTSVKRQV